MNSTNRFRSLAKDAIMQIESDTHGCKVTHEDIEVSYMSFVSGYMKAEFVIPKKAKDRRYIASYIPTSDSMYVDEFRMSLEGTKVVKVGLGD